MISLYQEWFINAIQDNLGVSEEDFDNMKEG